MENGESVFSNYNNNGSRVQNSNNLSWDLWNSATSRFDWSNSFNEDHSSTSPATATGNLLFTHPANNAHHHSPSFYSGDLHVHPDPYLTCLKLGKRHYFEDSMSAGFPIGKRGKSFAGGSGGGDGLLPSSSPAGERVSPAVVVPRCQVEGCHIALLNAKDYHRRHKVCETHSKATKAIVLGLEQRFCQQCSRFHVVSEFDDSKRSCRRRLAGHNERRRKNSNDLITRNPSHDGFCVENKSLSGRIPCISESTGRALSLLSSKTTRWVSSADDISSRSSTALRELIAENRASILSRQLFLDRSSNHAAMDDLGQAHLPHHLQMFGDPSGWHI